MAEQNKIYENDDRSLNVLFGLKIRQIRNENVCLKKNLLGQLACIVPI